MKYYSKKESIVFSLWYKFKLNGISISHTASRYYRTSAKMGIIITFNNDNNILVLIFKNYPDFSTKIKKLNNF